MSYTSSSMKAAKLAQARESTYTSMECTYIAQVINDLGDAEWVINALAAELGRPVPGMRDKVRRLNKRKVKLGKEKVKLEDVRKDRLSKFGRLYGKAEKTRQRDIRAKKRKKDKKRKKSSAKLVVETITVTYKLQEV